MNKKYYNIDGVTVTPGDLNLNRCKDLAINLDAGRIDFAHFISCLKCGGNEIVVFDVDIEVPQLPEFKILNKERIAVTFYSSDDIIPKVEAIRIDFPLVPHLNLHLQEFPRDLCIYEESYNDLKRNWTSARFVHRIRDWLALNAKGELHQEDQSLEQLIIGGSGHIILPHDFRHSEYNSSQLYLLNCHSEGKKYFLIATPDAKNNNKIPPFIASIHICQPLTHGTINRQPLSFKELTELVSKYDIDLVSELKSRFMGWKDSGAINSPLILIIRFPKMREKDGNIEEIEDWAFIIGDSIKIIGEKIGIWKDYNGELGAIIKSQDDSFSGEDIPVDVLNVSYELTSQMAAFLNNRNIDDPEPNITAIGVGALGSQIVMNLAKAGFGKWSLIDDDRLMPHNTTRHALNGNFIGYNKADAVAFLADSIIADTKSFTSIPANLLFPGNHESKIKKAMEDTDVIIDMSTSITVARKIIYDLKSNARRLSVFLNPTGSDLVMLAEDNNRNKTLDALEMQYYRSIINDNLLDNHLQPAEGRQSYGRSCRDITLKLPQYKVALHSAVGARAIEEVIGSPDASISIWQLKNNLNIQSINIKPEVIIRHEVGDWTIITDDGLIAKLNKLRQEKLPNETGGVLLGSFDLERKVLYIVDTVPSPPDSKEWPILYIRGCKGLIDSVKKVGEKTNGMVEYIGEWHSHPPGSNVAASDDDIKVFSWLSTVMDRDGLPALMMIVGDSSKVSCYIGEIDKEENLIPPC